MRAPFLDPASVNASVNMGALALLVAVLAGIFAFLARRQGPRSALRALPALGLTGVFVALTHLPWPGPDWPGCGGVSTQPLLEGLRFFDAVARHLYWQRSTLYEWAVVLTVSDTALNLHFCILIGMSFALCLPRLWIAALLGMGLTLTVELSQLTGVFGLAPCPWRQFDVDDLILNGAGIVIGFALMRGLGRIWPALPAKEAP